MAKAARRAARLHTGRGANSPAVEAPETTASTLTAFCAGAAEDSHRRRHINRPGRPPSLRPPPRLRRRQARRRLGRPTSRCFGFGCVGNSALQHWAALRCRSAAACQAGAHRCGRVPGAQPVPGPPPAPAAWIPSGQWARVIAPAAPGTGAVPGSTSSTRSIGRAAAGPDSPSAGRPGIAGPPPAHSAAMSSAPAQLPGQRCVRMLPGEHAAGSGRLMQARLRWQGRPHHPPGGERVQGETVATSGRRPP